MSAKHRFLTLLVVGLGLASISFASDFNVPAQVTAGEATDPAYQRASAVVPQLRVLLAQNAEHVADKDQVKASWRQLNGLKLSRPIL